MSVRQATAFGISGALLGTVLCATSWALPKTPRVAATDAASEAATDAVSDTDSATDSITAPVSDMGAFSLATLGEAAVAALATAYPRRAAETAFRNNDWAVRIDDTWFYWAEGRLLPEQDLPNRGRYAPHTWYRYTPGPPAAWRLDPGQEKRLSAAIALGEKHPPLRHSGIFNALWRIDGHRQSEERMKTLYFLGKATLVHRELLEDLAAIEEEILLQARNDPAIKAFIATLNTVEGYYWRPIAGTESISLHAFGCAIDLLPSSWGRKASYWRWSRVHTAKWWTLPLHQRYLPPPGVVAAFEKHGFVWGGRWLLFDTMHFEYRPELFIINGIAYENR